MKYYSMAIIAAALMLAACEKEIGYLGQFWGWLVQPSCFDTTGGSSMNTIIRYGSLMILGMATLLPMKRWQPTQ